MNIMKGYLDLARLSVKTRIGYRFDFVVGSVGIVLSNIINLGLLLILTLKFDTLMGWNFWELVFMYNLWLFSHGFYSTFFRNIENLQTLVVSGDFDKMLVKPVSPLVQLIGGQFYFYGAGDWAISGTMLALSYVNLELAWGPGAWIFLVLAVVSGFLIETAISLILSTLSFWLGKTDGLNWLVFQFNYALTQRYPVDIYFAPLRVLLTFIFPFAFMNYFPGVVLLGRWDKVLFHPLVHYAGPALALGLGALALVLWNRGLKAYKSSGS